MEPPDRFNTTRTWAVAVAQGKPERTCSTPKRSCCRSGKVEQVLKCRTRKKGRYAPQVHMTETREITPYVWIHPDEKAEPPACAGELR
jgi:hypothetical protein